MTSPFWGSEVTEQEIASLLGRLSLSVHRSNSVETETAKRLAEGKIVGWIQGRSEVGARALGHRSIFADPRDPSIKDRLNARVKQRESWRPFAPMVLEEDVSQFFTDPRPSPFMTFTAPTLRNAGIPATTHVDGTARVQTVNAVFDCRVHRLLCAFKQLTGIGVLLNTSFNVKGEPIVRNAEDAYRDFMGTGMDALILGDYIIDKRSEAARVDSPIVTPMPRIRVTNRLPEIVLDSNRAAIVSLGTDSFLEDVQRSLTGFFGDNSHIRVFVPPPSGLFGSSLGFCEMLISDANAVPVSACFECDVLLLLLPTWTEVAVDLIPNLLAPFIELSPQFPAVRVFLLDEAGGALRLDSIMGEWRQTGTRGPISEVEHLWLTRRTEK
jgi:hypothetical protein